MLGCREEDSSAPGFFQQIFIDLLVVVDVNPQAGNTVVHRADIGRTAQGLDHNLRDFIVTLFPDQYVIRGRFVFPSRRLDVKLDDPPFEQEIIDEEADHADDHDIDPVGIFHHDAEDHEVEHSAADITDRRSHKVEG